MALNDYKNLNGPLEIVFRNGDSTWSLARPQELEAGQIWWKKKLEAGTASAFIEEREKERARVGQTSCVWATKK